MKRKFLLFLLVGSMQVIAQTVPASLDQALRNTLDSMQTQVLHNKSLSAAIQFDATTSWSYATGISEENPTVLVTPDDVYEIGSVTKTMTAGAILKLVDQGVLHLDDSLHQWLPAMNYIDSNITIRQLLRHQSGLYDALANPANQPTLLNDMSKIWMPQEILDTFLLAPLAAPGGTWNYCNTNYFLLAMIIKAATGLEYHQFIRTNFFTPLQLNSIAVPAFEPLTSPVAHVWIDLNNDNVLDDAHAFYFNWLSLNSNAGAAGGYYATAKDVSKWIRSYLRGDFHSATLLQEAKITIPAPGLPATTYGLGLMKKTFQGLQGYGHGGDLAYSSNAWYFPEKDISITVLNNDSKKISWDLISTVNALLKTYLQWTIVNEVSQPLLETTSIEVYPNPSAEYLNVKFNSFHSAQMNLQIYNTLGVVVQTKRWLSNQGDNLVSMNTSNLPNGLYTLIIQDGNTMHQEKIRILHTN